MDRQDENLGGEAGRDDKDRRIGPEQGEEVPASEACTARDERGDALAAPSDRDRGDGADPPDDDGTEDGFDLLRQRHDAFTEARKSAYLKALAKTGCILDACRLTGVSARTVYRHRDTYQEFDLNCAAALRMCGTPVELTAWQRAVDGVEEQFVAGGKVRVRMRYSDGLLRLLLQGSNPKKYGVRPGFSRKRLLKYERKRIEREVRAELEERMGLKPMSFDEAIEKLDRALRHWRPQDHLHEFGEGWTITDDGYPIPPGYGPLPGGSAEPGGKAARRKTPRDSM